MTSTFVNDLRLNEMATGDQSGSWGTVTNTNLELIGEALGYGTEGITTNANTHTSTIADGATDPVRALYVEYTGTLDSACTVTIAPNTVNKVCFIENGTSGSQNIIIKQGSGATITIPPGDTKAVYLDGAGSGAKVVDAFASLSVVDLKVQDDLTVTGVLTTTAATVFNGGFASNGNSTVDGTFIPTGVVTANAGVVVDTMTLDAATLTATGDFTIDSAGDIVLDADGADIKLKDAGTLFGSLVNNSGEFKIVSEVSDGNMVFRGNDGGVFTTALTLDMQNAGAATFNAGITTTGTCLIKCATNDNIRISQQTHASIQAINDAANAFVDLKLDGSTITINGQSTGGTVIGNGLTLTAGDIVMPANISHAGDADTFFGFPSANTIKFTTGNVEAFVVSTTDVVVNDSGADMNFRAESSGSAHALVVDAGVNQVLIGKATAGLTTNGAYFANVVPTAGAHFHLGIAHTNTDGANALLFLNRQSSDGNLIDFRHANTAEGTISISGATVSYNGFAGRHESSGIATNTAVGTVVSTIDELDVYPDTQPDSDGGVMASPKAGQTRANHAKVKVSDSVGDNRVYGVVDNFETNEKVNVISVGIASVKVTGSCAGGDLLESNGDGTAKVQSDDIVRGKTIGKVTIGNTDTSVKLVACVMYCG